MNGAPFVEMPEPFRLLQAKMLRQPGGDRDPLGTLLRNTLSRCPAGSSKG
jgi:hypothetical protein